jgi:hemerythrin
MITWDESFSTGLPEIDEQHQNLIDKCNEFFQAIVNGTGRETAGDVLDYLRYYAAWHFEKEETCMEEYRCPAAAANKKAHGEFLDKFERFYAQWQA